MNIKLREISHVFICSTKEKAIVYMTFLCCSAILIIESLKRCCLRIGIWHFKVRCHTTIGCSTTLTLYISLSLQPWLTKMNMFVYYAWHNVTALCINYFIIVSTRCRRLIYSLNKVINNNKVALKRATFINYYSVFY